MDCFGFKKLDLENWMSKEDTLDFFVQVEPNKELSLNVYIGNVSGNIEWEPVRDHMFERELLEEVCRKLKEEYISYNCFQKQGIVLKNKEDNNEEFFISNMIS